MIEHRHDDWLAAICGPGRVRPDTHAVAPGCKAKALNPKDPLKLEGMFALGLVAHRIFGERARRHRDLLCYKGNQ
jgi:hypothetical protein